MKSSSFKNSTEVAKDRSEAFDNFWYRERKKITLIDV